MKPTKKKLELNAETIRMLGRPELVQVNGGWGGFSRGCGTGSGGDTNDHSPSDDCWTADCCTNDCFFSQNDC